jgi:hypothetical protein
MKYSIIVFFVFTFLFSSCAREDANPVTPEELTIAPFLDTVGTFCNKGQWFELRILSGNTSTDDLRLEMDYSQYFYIGGIGYSDPSRTKLSLQIVGIQVTPGTIAATLGIHVGSQVAQVPIQVCIPDFYYAHRFLTNAPNDTVILSKGGDFLLSITCLDTSDNIVSKLNVMRYSGGISSTYISKNYQRDKFVYTSYDGDTTNFYFMLSAFSDITPSPDDTSTYFNYEICNKRLRMPVRFSY